MQFGETPLKDLENAILAHSLRLKDFTFKKGRILSADDVSALQAAGYKSVTAAVIEEDDVREDEAANRLAERIAGNGVKTNAAFTGRSNFYAECDGIVLYDRERLDAFNLVDEAITLAAIPPYQVVEKGQMVATLKIIPFAVDENLLSIAENILQRGGPFFQIKYFESKSTALIQTRLPGVKETVLDKTYDVTRARIEALHSSLDDEIRCDHNEAELSTSIIRQVRKGAELILISGASAVVDRRDVIPASIEKAGGRVVHFGMPVDPGNLMLFGTIGDIPVIGLPGCARSPKLNGFDWVLQRTIANLEITPRDVMQMGAGGFLKEIPTRPLPRASIQSEKAKSAGDGGFASARQPRVAAMVLAGGQSRRMGKLNKLLAEIDGVPMIRRTVENIVASDAYKTFVVTGHESDTVRNALDGLDVTFIQNDDFAGGLSTSMIAGLKALPDDIDGVVICLGDMPRIECKLINRLISAYDPIENRAICVPTFQGKRGNPVLWDKRFFEEMLTVSGDVGARHLIGDYGEMVAEVEMEDDAVMIDIDTPDALAALKSGSLGT